MVSTAFVRLIDPDIPVDPQKWYVFRRGPIVMEFELSMFDPWVYWSFCFDYMVPKRIAARASC